ncbi:MAG TPA: AraC family transcriptional regulator [Blastocatellia bacterium]|nr:AraC family transcriptional regulator [Blastocatellia bacterium]
MPRHEHEPAYFGIVLDGGYSETFGMGLRTREAGPLVTAFHPPGESHSVVFHNRQVRIFRIEIGEAWRRRIEAHSSLPDEPTESSGGVPASLTLRLDGEYQRRDAWSALAIEGLSLEIMAEMARGAAKSPRWLEEVRDLLASRPAETHSLEELAAGVGVHPVRLAREFRKRYRSTVGDFVRRLRIEAACKEIAGTDAPLSEIAPAAGFYDQSHFTNTFRRFTGMTPAAYRTACRAR